MLCSTRRINQTFVYVQGSIMCGDVEIPTSEEALLAISPPQVCTYMYDSLFFRCGCHFVRLICIAVVWVRYANLIRVYEWSDDLCVVVQESSAVKDPKVSIQFRPNVTMTPVDSSRPRVRFDPVRFPRRVALIDSSVLVGHVARVCDLQCR